MGKACRIKVYGGVKKQTIDLCDTEEEMENMTVCQLKGKVARSLGKDEDDFRLVYRDISLRDDWKRLSWYGVANMSLIHVVQPSVAGAFSSSRSSDNNCLIL